MGPPPMRRVLADVTATGRLPRSGEDGDVPRRHRRAEDRQGEGHPDVVGGRHDPPQPDADQYRAELERHDRGRTVGLDDPDQRADLPGFAALEPH